MLGVHEWQKPFILAVSFPTENTSIRLAASGCRTPFGDTDATFAALLRGECALRPTPVLGADGGDAVPLALCPGHTLNETAPPSWLRLLGQLAEKIPGDGWGSPRRPVFVTSSNFGVGNLHAFRRTHDAAHLAFATPSATVALLQAQLGWGANVALLSHACVSAHLGLLLATRTLHAGLADEALVFSFDFLSPFVTGGFHALKILNADFPAPYQDRDMGAIGLGDGVAFAVLTRGRGDLALLAQSLYNEMHHFTANQPDGAGFDACLAPLAAAAGQRRTWLKGHGTGTLEAGRLEAGALARSFPGAPLVSWKGSLGHTLGSCGLVELALAAAALRAGRTPGTIGSAAPAFTDAVALEPFDNRSFDAVLCASNAFGGAHAALLLTHV
jgi:3-oxoacyl-(acyl-carrier-protein) synthase